MHKRARFITGIAGVGLIVGYLVWTGVQDTMVYYLTPTELVAKVSTDASFHEVGVKVGARVIEGSLESNPDELEYRFRVKDIETEGTTFPVVYNGPLPDTFQEGRDVVLEGRFTEAGVFEATTLLTKCGSRYEASPEELRR